VPVFRLLNEILGPDASLAGLSHEDGERIFETVQRIPVNANKLRPLRELSLRDAIDEAARLGLPTLAPKTINDGYMANLGSLFRFAVKRGWMKANPVDGLRVRQEVAAKEAREPFGKRLPKLFAAPPWSPQDTSGGGKPIRYWGPLLALYQGLRLGEIAGLLVEDVSEENGQPMLHIRPGKRPLKTESSRRDLPIHPELIRLGFLRFVEERNKATKGAGMLFAGEKAYARGQWGRGLGDWFVRHLRSLGLTGRKLTFHSFRHDFRDALREAEIDPALADYLMGHAQHGMGAIYGAGRPSVARLRRALEGVVYTGLRLPAAHEEP
jgi:integrase